MAAGWEQALKPIAFGFFYYAVKMLAKYMNSYYQKKKALAAEKREERELAKKKALEEAEKKGPVSKGKAKKLERKAEQKRLADQKKGTKSYEKNKGDAKKAALAVGLAVGMCALATGYCYRRYGPMFFVGQHNKMMKLTSVEWQHILKNRSVCFVGGHHRAGTTVAWRAIAQHPEVAWFGEQRESGLDYSEGAFAQDVYPRFGIGLDLSVQSIIGGHKGGVGQYALKMPPSEVMWTEERANADIQARLLNSFGFLWNNKNDPGIDDASILLEKSPPNVVIARFLQGVIDISESSPRRPSPVEKKLADDDFFEGATCKPMDSRARFVFVTRHPIPVALSQYGFGAKVKMPELIAHWIAIETYAKRNSACLKYVKRVKLEDLAADPISVVADVWNFLGLKNDQDLAIRAVQGVRNDPNKDHREAYCAKIKESPADMHQHQLMIDTFNFDIQSFGYDLNTFCPPETIDDEDRTEASPQLQQEEL